MVERAEVGVGPELDVLVPVDLGPAARPLVVELGVVEPDGATEQLLGQAGRRTLQGEPAEGVVVIEGRDQSPQPRSVGRTVVGLDVDHPWSRWSDLTAEPRRSARPRPAARPASRHRPGRAGAGSHRAWYLSWCSGPQQRCGVDDGGHHETLERAGPPMTNAPLPPPAVSRDWPRESPFPGPPAASSGGVGWGRSCGQEGVGSVAGGDVDDALERLVRPRSAQDVANDVGRPAGGCPSPGCCRCGG